MQSARAVMQDWYQTFAAAQRSAAFDAIHALLCAIGREGQNRTRDSRQGHEKSPLSDSGLSAVINNEKVSFQPRHPQRCGRDLRHLWRLDHDQQTR